MYASPFTFGRREVGLKDAKYAVLGVPYDSSQSYRTGSRFAPNAIREASREIEDYDMLGDFDLLDIKICDIGDVDISFGNFEETLKRTESSVRDILKQGVVPVILGGEHTISYCAVSAYDEKPFCVVFDAHLDFREEYLGNRFSHASTIKRVGELVGFDNMLVVGARSACLEEVEDAKKAGLNFLDFNECNSIEKVKKIISKETAGKNVYLSIDTDVLDPTEARGVSNPEPPGFSYAELLECISAITKARLVGMDLVEICPSYDSYTPILGAKLIFRVLEEFERRSRPS